MLVDKVGITVTAGKGGAGCVSFRREKYIPKGGPDGGNGGDGGSVYVRGENNIYLLKKFREAPHVRADKGQMGTSRKKSGGNAEDLLIKVPFGTKITNVKNGSYLEILDDSDTYLLAQGGRGGRGNWEFRSATNQTPREFGPGGQGQSVNYLLELQLIANIGLIGLPNAGKSTLLNALTQANVKTAAYPFTTLEPNLGTMDRLIVADVPGLIEGAAKGKGLGFRFLRHIERTQLLVHCLSCESTQPLKDYQVIMNELGSYNPKLLDLPQILVLTKIDVIDEPKKKELQKIFKKIKLKPLFVSVLLDESLEELKQTLLSLT